MPIKISRLLPVFAAILVSSISCNKHSIQGSQSNHELFAEARRFFADSVAGSGTAANYRASLDRRLLWDEAQLVPFKAGTGVLVPIVFSSPVLMKANFAGPDFFHIDYLTQAFIYKDSSQRFTCRVLTSFPDSNYFKDPTRHFTGIRYIEDWSGRIIEKLLYTNDGKVMQFRPTNVQPASVVVIQTCYVISGVNYTPATGDSYAWTEVIGCNYSLTDVGAYALASVGFSGSGGGAGPSPAAAFTVLPGSSVIKSIKSYFQCFTNVGGNDHTYTVTVAVAQPVPGSRNPWTTSGNGSSGSSTGANPVFAGHTFLILSESYGNTTITRNVGFYPATDVSPWSITSQGMLNDDETHSYNISGTFKVNNAQFFNLLNYVSQGSNTGYLYDLNTNNCTTFAINAAYQAGISLPRTNGTWPGGGIGNDPGDLGQDLRSSNISGMSLNLSGGTNYSHFNVGQCN